MSADRVLEKLRPWPHTTIASAPAGAQFFERREVIDATEDVVADLERKIAVFEDRIFNLEEDSRGLVRENSELEEKLAGALEARKKEAHS